MLDILMPETASAPASARRRYVLRSAILLPGFLLGFLIPSVMELGGLGIGLQVLSVLFCIGLIFEFVVLMRALDELQNRIHMTALAIAGGAVAGTGTLWGVIAMMSALSGPEAAFAMPVFGLAYYAALFFVSRHYQ